MKMLKKGAYASKALSAYHRLNNSGCLTVVMFHRVLAENDASTPEADPAWTVSSSVFRDCLEFFARHYNVIGMNELLLALSAQTPWPNRPLLITFDDGWADNAEYALPILRETGLPATVFVVAEGIDQEELWQESLLRAWRQKILSQSKWDELWSCVAGKRIDGPPEWSMKTAVWELVNLLSALPPERRAKIVEPFREALGRPQRRQMLSRQQLRSLYEAGVTIGSHGMTHTPLPYSAEAEWESIESRIALSKHLGIEAQEISAFSFPRGIWNLDSIRTVQRAGYQVSFTSDACLNPLQNGEQKACVFGRINMAASEITDQSGRLSPELLALWLFDRPRRTIDGSNSAVGSASQPAEILA